MNTQTRETASKLAATSPTGSSDKDQTALGRDRDGVNLIAGDRIRAHNATWQHADLIVRSAHDGNLTVANSANPSITFDVNPAHMRVVRIDLTRADLGQWSIPSIAADRDFWADRDPRYAARAQEVIDALAR